MKITKKLMKMMLVFSILSIAIGIGCKQEETTQTVANDFFFKVQFAIGDVKIIKTDPATAAKTEAVANPGDEINIDNTIVTGSKSSVDLLYGTSGIVRINENSKVSIAAIADNQNTNTVVNMEQGKVFAAFSKLKGGTGFNVKTPTVVASVRGTSFTVENDILGARVAVLKGSVKAAPVKDGEIIENKEVSVKENHRTDYITETTVHTITTGKKENIPVSKMTAAEITVMHKEVKDIDIDAIQDLSPKEKENIKKEITFGDAGKKPEVKQPAKKDDKEDKAAAAAEAKRKAEEEKKRLEAEKKKKEEQVKQKEEQVKKERISNIPTM